MNVKQILKNPLSALRKTKAKTADQKKREAAREAKRELKEQKEQEKSRLREARLDAEKRAEEERQAVRRIFLREFAVESAKPDFDRRIPPPSINYNQMHEAYHPASYRQYYRDFISGPVLRQLPALLQIAGYGGGQAEFNLLDYGCGLGRLAFAYSNFFEKNPARRYTGYEVHPRALSFLREAYADFSNVKFFGDPLTLDDSYVEIHQGADAVEESARIKASEVSLSSGFANL